MSRPELESSRAAGEEEMASGDITGGIESEIVRILFGC